MRLIDADALEVTPIDITDLPFGECLNVVLLEDIESAHTVEAIPVIRCKYCKHFTEGMAIGKCYLNPDKPIIPVFYNHFCSYGERRKGDEDERNER